MTTAQISVPTWIIKPHHGIDSRCKRSPTQSTQLSAVSRSRDVVPNGVKGLDTRRHRDERLVESVLRVSDDDSEDSQLDRDSEKSKSSSLERSLLSRVNGLTKLTAEYLVSSSEEDSET